jgi:hypothetical protein
VLLDVLEVEKLVAITELLGVVKSVTPGLVGFVGLATTGFISALNLDVSSRLSDKRLLDIIAHLHCILRQQLYFFRRVELALY